MSYELRPRTKEGESFIEATESVIKILRDRADNADKKSIVDVHNLADMLSSGIIGAFVPKIFGGFGLTSIHDWMVGISRLGQGDGSVALMVNMHLAISRGMMETWNASKKSINKKLTKKLELQFEQIISGNMFLCATATEIGTDNLHPFTEATRVEDGWIINGKKIFVTGSPIASHVAMNLRIRNKKETTTNNEDDVIGAVILPLETEGVITQDDWQAMGMRGSGSQSIFFENVFLPEDIVRPIGQWGKWSSGLLMNRNLANLPLLGAFLGIAEHAYELALVAAKEKPKSISPSNMELPGIQHIIGEMEISISTTRAMVGQMGQITDDFLKKYKNQKIPIEQAHELLKDHQSMKWVVNRNAIDIVNKALDVVGGSGYLDKNTISRLYRDVRAGPFMQPYAPSEAREYIGKVVLGIYPEN